MFRITRSALPVALSLLSLASASSPRADCLLARGGELAALSSCGDTGALSSCLSAVAADASLSVVQDCFKNAGCSDEDSAIEAGFVLKQCEQGVKGAELKFRNLESMPKITGASLGGRADPPLNFVPPLQCSTNTMIRASTCIATVIADKATQSCFETQVQTQVCDSKNVCMKDSNGLDVCMVRKDMPTTSGMVITIFLAVVFVIGIATIIFLCCRDAREAKRIKAQHEAAQIAKSNKMAAAAPPPPAAAGPGGQDPFGDNHGAPQL